MLEDMSDVQDDMTDVFRTTKIKINGGVPSFLNGPMMFGVTLNAKKI